MHAYFRAPFCGLWRAVSSAVFGFYLLAAAAAAAAALVSSRPSHHFILTKSVAFYTFMSFIHGMR